MENVITKRKLINDQDDKLDLKRQKRDSSRPLPPAFDQTQHHSQEGTPQFELFHLSVLQSLYSDIECDATDQKGENDTVEKELWSKARKFVLDRRCLAERKEQASLLNSIHSEALVFLRERDATRNSPAALKKPAVSMWHFPSDQTIVPVLASSSTCHHGPGNQSASTPLSLNFFSPSRSATETKSASSAECQGPKPPSQCFGLLVSLLGKKSNAFDVAVARKSDPYRPFLRAVEGKMRKIKGKLQTLKEENLAKQKQTMDDLLSRPVLLSSLTRTPRKNWVSKDTKATIDKLEAKLRLWNMLSTDLKSIVGE